jgi:hypothetical protein
MRGGGKKRLGNQGVQNGSLPPGESHLQIKNASRRVVALRSSDGRVNGLQTRAAGNS